MMAVLKLKAAALKNDMVLQQDIGLQDGRINNKPRVRIREDIYL